MEYLKQIYYEMRHQKMMTWVSISGTALAIFLVMVFFFKESAMTVSIPPLSERSRILMGKYLEMRQEQSSNSGSFSRETGRKIYGDLDGVERMSFISSWSGAADVSTSAENAFSATTVSVDDEFWNICDFTFIDGRPFEAAEVKDNVPVVVVTRSIARKLFNKDKVSGQEILLDMIPYRIVGVVNDPSPLFSDIYGEIYKVFPNEESTWGPMDMMGEAMALLLMEKGSSEEDIRTQVKTRYNLLNQETMKENWSVVYHEQPYNAETLAGSLFGSNNSPDMSTKNRQNLLIYGILILLPAINLSSMTRSRLRHRISEIGVRRAFGASKLKIITQLFGENFIITVIGGAIGLLFCFLFTVTLSHYFIEFGDPWSNMMGTTTGVRPTFSMLFTWSTFFVALGVCFLLNILSATIPSWKASSVPPAIAINKVK